MGDYNDHLLPDRCLRLDFGGEEYNSIELGDGTGFVRRDHIYDLVAGEHVISTHNLRLLLDEWDACGGELGGDRAIKHMMQMSIDLEAMKVYARMVRALFKRAYVLASTHWLESPKEFVSIEYAKRMNELRADMLELGIEVE